MTITAGMDFVVHRWVIYPNFTAMEQAQAKKELSRCVAALQAEINHLDAFADDWAAWNDTYRFIAERTRAYIDSNLGPRTFMDNRLNLIAFYDSAGNRVWGRTYNLKTGRPVPIQPFNALFLEPAHTLLNRAGSDIPIRGIFPTDHGPMLIASRAILTSDRQGPAKGSLPEGWPRLSTPLCPTPWRCLLKCATPGPAADIHRYPRIFSCISTLQRRTTTRYLACRPGLPAMLRR